MFKPHKSKLSKNNSQDLNEGVYIESISCLFKWVDGSLIIKKSSSGIRQLTPLGMQYLGFIYNENNICIYINTPIDDIVKYVSRVQKKEELSWITKLYPKKQNHFYFNDDKSMVSIIANNSPNGLNINRIITKKMSVFEKLKI